MKSASIAISLSLYRQSKRSRGQSPRVVLATRNTTIMPRRFDWARILVVKTITIVPTFSFHIFSRYLLILFVELNITIFVHE